MKIALYGFMGAGKSVLGKALANKLGHSFVDLDIEIEQQTGKTINEIFQQQGEIAFRSIEHRVLKEFIKENRENVVLSLGGGTIIQPTNRQLLDLREYKKVFLDVDINTLIQRLQKEKANRPLLKDLPEKDFDNFVKALWTVRYPVYKQYADMVLPIEEDNFEQTLEKLYAYFNYN